MNIAAYVEVNYSDLVPCYHKSHGVAEEELLHGPLWGVGVCGQRFLSEQPAARTRTKVYVELLKLVSSQMNHFCWQIQFF